MEEILASIRRIIAEDPAPAARPTRKAADGTETLSKKNPQAFEDHFHAATEDHAAPSPADEEIPSFQPDPSPEDEAPLELNQPLAAAALPADEEEILELTEIAGPADAAGDAILSDAIATATAERLQRLSQMVVRSEGSVLTLEGLVREMLRPMLKQWLDANLPDIVDQAVSREIARLTGKGR